MTQTGIKDILKKEGVRFGLVGMVVYAIAIFILHAISIDALTSVMFRAIPWFLMLTAAFFACVMQLKAQGDILLFPDAMVTILIVFAFCEFGAVLGEYLLYNVVDTELPEKMKLIQLEKAQENYDGLKNTIGYAEGDEEEILTQVENANYNFSALQAVLKFVTWLFVDFLFALLLGAIVRKEPITS